MKRTWARTRKADFLRLFLLGSLAVSDLGCWAAFFYFILHAGQGVGLGVVSLLLAALLLAVCFSAVWQGLYRQLDELENAAQNWDALSQEDRNARISSLSGQIGRIGASFCKEASLIETTLQDAQDKTREETERTVKIQITRDICQYALPGQLPDYPNRVNFDIAGIVRDGWMNACVFYDYFFVDHSVLCIVVGQVPDGGVPGALYMTMAQTTIRSRLRLGRSLADALADVNTQMYDQGRERSAAVLVALLDTATGRLAYVNAGSCAPLIMRNNEDYEWLDAPRLTALGQTQNVAYRTQELRLRQGDRIFFHTSGLGAQKNADGTAFRDHALRSALIRTQTPDSTAAASLNVVSEQAALAVKKEDRLGYAATLLEFRKGDRELAYCRVPSSPDSAPKVMEFLKSRFAENGVERRHYARVAVLTEELFSLCCQNSVPGSLLTVECGVAPDGESVTIRVTGAFHGKSPMRSDGENTPCGQSAEFIEEQAEYTRFKAGKTDDRDMLTMVCFLTQ